MADYSDPAYPTSNGSDYAGQQKADTVLDSPENKARLKKLQAWFNEARLAQADARAEMALDENFVDGLQWSEEDRQAMEERGQSPLVFNEILPAVLWVEGTERRARSEWKILPRADDDVEDALIKTEVMRYISDVNRARFERSKAFRHAVRAGIGWLEVCVNGDPAEEVVKFRAESWRNVWPDHYARDLCRDGRFLFRSKVVDTDIAQAMFPKRAEAIKHAAQQRGAMPYWGEDESYDGSQFYRGNDWRSGGTSSADLSIGEGQREGVRLVEAWYREPATVDILRGASNHPLNGTVLNKSDPTHAFALQAGELDLVRAVRKLVRFAVFIDGGVMLAEGPSPYRHNLFPFVPIVGYRREMDGAFYGMVRNARDPQEDLNKRRSKALFVLSTRRVIGDKGAIDPEDMDDFEDEVARPDAILWKNKGYDLTVDTDNALAEEHIALAQQNAEYIRHTSGVTGENMGQETNAQSGKAILARQNQGTVVTAALFDNALEADQISGEIALSLIEQFMPEERLIRVVGNRGAPKFTPINKRMPDGTILNDITRTAADFIVSEQDYRESMRVALAEQMMEMIGKLSPDVSLGLLDLAVELFDLPNKEEMVQRIRRLNGQFDPDAPNAAEEAEAADAAKKEAEAKLQELTRQEMETTIEERRAKTDKLKAETQSSKLQSLLDALQAAVQALQAPGIAGVAQDLIEGADVARPGTTAPQLPMQQLAAPQRRLPPPQMGAMGSGPAPAQAGPQPKTQPFQPNPIPTEDEPNE